MAFGWLMPTYRKPLWIETVVHDGLCQSQAHVDWLIGNSDMLTQWQHHLHRQPASIFFIVISMSVLWIFVSYLSSWKHQRVVQTPAPQGPSALTSPPPSSSPPQASNKNVTPPNESPVRPVMIATAPRLAGTSSNVPSLQSDHHLAKRTGLVSTPGYQTPLVTNPGKLNFSGLSKAAPVSYDTLQRNGILNQDGTPTKKYSHGLGKGQKISLDDEEAVYPYDSPTRTWGRPKQSPQIMKEVQRQAEGVKALWVDDPDDGRVQHFSPVKGESKTS
ncbi:hypothetical protein EKO04_000202 [Ascochyta lentis]|uniref:Uncharacterized protein n=1 Tax=Ascochyta lentis TaxID=205686 RepID=A0A8H7JEN2_9PLEO|nr:hypothetical protein EKO04_000202 [Ascochyta lentis]